jgi:hypothetical protein
VWLCERLELLLELGVPCLLRIAVPRHQIVVWIGLKLNNHRLKPVGSCYGLKVRIRVG